MSIQQSRATLTGRIWEALGRSGVTLESLSRADQERLVGAVADAMLVTLDELLGEQGGATRPAAGSAGGDEEQILWEGRPFLSLGEHYTVTTERVRIRKGLLGRSTDDIELARLQDVDVAQHVGERMANIGDITLRAANKSDPTLVLQNVHDPERVHEIIRRAMLDARRRHGVRLRDELEQ